MPRAAKPQISFADWELLRQGISLEPLLQSISDFLDDQEEMIEAVRRDLERGLTDRSQRVNPATGADQEYAHEEILKARSVPENAGRSTFVNGADGLAGLIGDR